MPNQIIEGTFELPVDNDGDNLTYKLFYVSSNNREEIDSIDGNKFEFILSEQDAENSYIELVVSDGTEEVTIKSNVFNVTTKIEEPKKGCSSCKKDQMLLWQSLTLLSASLLIILRKSKNR